ncbi:MAG: SWIM zinc finger family protein, partial [Hyphomicrobiaceae bacterium]|nr:SWIM zinc finger family protein [Hyphomicrobiaceae bacterium]
GAEHNYTEPKTTRVWGRRRLKLIEGLLPFADGVDIYLKGRALPSFYAVKLPGMTFLLGLTGWSGSGFTGTGGFDLLAEAAAGNDDQLEPALALLRQRYQVSIDELSEVLGTELVGASRLLVRLCRQGRAMFDVETRRYRHRELFEMAADEAVYFPPDRRQQLASALFAEGKVRLASCAAEETKKVRSFRDPNTGEAKQKIVREITYRDWRVIGAAGDREPVEIVVNDTGRIIFGRCTCPHFAEHLMNQGPCEHMLALFKASDDLRADRPSSAPVVGPTLARVRTQPARSEVDGADAEAHNE